MDTIIKIGQPAPLFELPDINGNTQTLRSYNRQVVILNFWSAECPWSKRVDEAILPLLMKWGKNVIYLPVAVNPNEPPDLVRTTASERGLLIVLLDSNQQVAVAYGAQVTPHVFLIDPIGMLRYHGAFDDVTFQQDTPSENYLENAVEALLSGDLPDPAQTDAYGCAIVRHTER